MSFSSYNPEDSVVSSELTVSGMWVNNSNTISTFFTSSNQDPSTKYYYLDVYTSTPISGSTQFDIQYGHVSGSGSININPDTPGYTPSRIIYGQYRNLIYETENSAILDANGNPLADVWAINISRSQYKESIRPGSISLTLSGSSGFLTLTDNSQILSTTQFIGSNEYYDLVSGSLGTVVNSVNKYGYVFPDLGIVLLNPASLNGYVTTPSRTIAGSDGQDNLKLLNSIVGGSKFSAQSQETISSLWFFTRIKNAEYNYTTNPSIIDDNGNLIYTDLINNPQTFITTIGLYNSNNELLAVAKLSKPFSKDFSSEALFRIKLSY